MPLSLLILLVIGGIGGITILLHALGLSQARKLDDESQVRTAWLREYPDTEIRAISLDSGGNGALVETGGGAGLVWVMGQDAMARDLTGARAEAVATGLRLRLPDPGAPRFDLRLSEDEARRWADRIGGQT